MIKPFSKVTFRIFQIIFTYLFKQVRLYDKELITWLFSYQSVYQTLSRLPSASPRALLTLGLDIWADMKTAV